MRHSAIVACAASLIACGTTAALATPIPYAEISSGFRAGLENASLFSTQLFGDPVVTNVSATGAGVAEAPAAVGLISPFYGYGGPTVGVGVRASTDGFGSAHAGAIYTGRVRFTNISGAPAQPIFAFYAAGNEGHAAVIDDAATQSASVHASGSYRIDDGSFNSGGLPRFDCAATFGNPLETLLYRFCARPFVFTQAGTLGTFGIQPPIAPGAFVDVVFSIEVSADVRDTSPAPEPAEVPEPGLAALMLTGLIGIVANRRRSLRNQRAA